MRRLAIVSLLVALTACADDSESVDELDSGGPLGKEDSTGVTSLPVNADYSDSQAWVVKNQWEDTDTPDARKAGMAWGENSGLNWDEKFALWVGSFQQIPSFDSWFKTVTVSTPFAK